ncbi:MAG: LamG domain-containing protein [Planctomycetota bacterium]|nr:LamG domain-containing protein [Planctomycetota bacterium]
MDRLSESVRGPSRRGGVYVLVLVVTTIVSGMALLGLRAAIAGSSEGRRVADSISARQHAASGMEIGIHTITTEPLWRVDRTEGTWLNKVAVGTGTATVAVETVGGGPYTLDAFEPVELTGIGFEGSSRSVLRAQVALMGVDSRDHIDLLFASGAAAYWPIDGLKSGGYEIDAVGDNSLKKSWSDSNVLPGVFPALGTNSAPWFTGTLGSMKAPSKDIYTDIRTVSVWFWVSSTTGLQGIVTRDASGRGTGGRWELAITNGELESMFDTTSRTVSLRGGTVPTGQWNHAVLTVADDQMRLYLNGVQVDRWSSTLLAGELAGCAPTETIRIGVSRRLRAPDHKGTNPITGAVCELALLKAPMSDAEVLALYEAYPAPAHYAIVADTWERIIQ